jgi:hypothetical protein
MNQFHILKLLKSLGFVKNQVVNLKSKILSEATFAIEVNSNNEGLKLWSEFN